MKYNYHATDVYSHKMQTERKITGWDFMPLLSMLGLALALIILL